MKKVTLVSLCAALSLIPASLFAEDSAPKVKLYGFIRNYYAFDSRESIAGTEDFFYYVPKDISLNDENDDINANPNFKFAALTSRLGVDVKGYEYKGWDFAAKIEADFYNGLSSTSNDPLTRASLTGTANLRLRQAYVTMSNYRWTFKAGQAWHPMAADMPHIFSLNTGAPFGPFSRTPLVSAEAVIYPGLSITAAAIWQQQYTSAGPYGASANYIRNGGGELYLGLNYKKGAFLARAGINALSITPRTVNDKKLKVVERSLTFIPFLYAQYEKGPVAVRFKTVLAQGGEHLNLNGGYAISGMQNDSRSYVYTPTLNSSSWASFKYKAGKLDLILFGGYVKNFGTIDPLLGENTVIGGYGKPMGFYFSKNSYDNLNSMWRITPEAVYNFGRLALGMEYECTSVQYGDKSQGMNLDKGLYDKGLHWVTNHRVQGIVKFTF